jgi:hypothetical protein
MSQMQDTPSRPGPTAKYLRPLTFAASWVALVALASCCFFAPRGTEAQPTINDVVGFGCSMAISGAAAAAMAVGIGGRRRWVVELMLCVAVLSSSAALLLVYVLWFDPTFARGHLDLWSFQRLQHGGREWAKQLAGYHGPLGAIVGIVLGTVAGLLTILGRHRPRLAMSTALIILFAFTSGLGRQFAYGMVTRLGWILRYHFVPGSISDDQISVTGMIFGAITGAVIANLAIYATSSQNAFAVASPGRTERVRRNSI